jgi:hypothetical protein
MEAAVTEVRPLPTARPTSRPTVASRHHGAAAPRRLQAIRAASASGRDGAAAVGGMGPPLPAAPQHEKYRQLGVRS